MDLTPHSAEEIGPKTPAIVNSSLSIVHIHIRFFLLRCALNEADGLHPIQRKTPGKVAGDFRNKYEPYLSASAARASSTFLVGT